VTLQPHQSPRAPRFSIPIAILYRTPGDATWLEGWTENISKSGVLFRADRELELDTPVEMMMEIPTFISTPVAGPAICRGRIVRAVGPSPLEDRPAFAAKILEYELARPSDPRRI
jgi:PilZ domain-containing protein